MRIRLFILLLILFASVGALALGEDSYPTERALREAIVPPADRYDLAQRFYGISGLTSRPGTGAPRSIGETQTFRVVDLSGAPPAMVDAELLAIGDHIYVWVEQGGGVATDAAQRFAEAFDTQVYDAVRDLWGSEPLPGVDGDPRIHALFTSAISAGTMAYFTSQNSYPAEVVPSSNEHDMILFNLRVTGGIIDSPQVVSSAAHEFQHMIRHAVDTNESTWLDEGFSTFTQRHLGLGDGRSLMLAFVSQPDTQLNDWGANGVNTADYGASLSFLTYFHSRLGIDALRRLSAEPADGLAAVDRTLRSLGAGDVETFFADWVLANAVDNPDWGYGDSSLPRVQPTFIPSLPFSMGSRLRQYSASYYYTTAFEGLNALDISLETAHEVPLLPFNRRENNSFITSGSQDESNPRLTRSFDLREVEHPVLEYRLWYDLERNWDYGYVSVSLDHGRTWLLQETSRSRYDNPNGLAYGPGYTGATDGFWIEERLDLSDYTGQEIMLRFEVITDDAISRPGMAIDDLRLEAIGYSEDFESGAEGWQMEGWFRTDNRLPQRIWLQAVQMVNGLPQLARWQIGPADGGRKQVQLDLQPGITSLLIVVAPFAEATTLPMDYSLQISPAS